MGQREVSLIQQNLTRIECYILLQIVFIEPADKEEELSQKWHFKREKIRKLCPRLEHVVSYEVLAPLVICFKQSGGEGRGM